MERKKNKTAKDFEKVRKTHSRVLVVIEVTIAEGTVFLEGTDK